MRFVDPYAIAAERAAVSRGLRVRSTPASDLDDEDLRFLMEITEGQVWNAQTREAAMAEAARREAVAIGEGAEVGVARKAAWL